jgi:hypothetical protein
MKVQGMELDGNHKRMSPNLELMEITMNGQTAFKQALTELPVSIADGK